MTDTAERLRVSLTKNIFSPVAGFQFGSWVRILGAQHWCISPGYIPRALFITMNGIANSLMSRREQREFGPRINDVTVPAPIFVLGHWRCGTTHLHNLLAQDPSFAYPTFYQATQPYTFLTTEKRAQKSLILKLLSPRTRIIDNMQASLDAPMEDEVALCILTGLSPIMSWLFPRQAERYDKYLTFRDVPDADIARWKEGVLYFLRKLTLKYERPVILKSPPHTCRVGLFLELFPDARFVHIHRHPYEVFRSYQRSSSIMRAMLQLQRPIGIDFDQRVIEQYRAMYDAFFEDRPLIPEGQFTEVRYDDLERDPFTALASIYNDLNLGSFETARPLIERYLKSISHFRKSELPMIEPSLKTRIAAVWERSFSEWGYAV